MASWHGSHRPLVASLVAIAGLSALFVAGALSGWPGTPIDCHDAMCFCELPRAGLIRQPSNTWSNLAALVASVVVAVAGRRGLRFDARKMPLSQTLAIAFPVALVWQGVGSALFHASLVTRGAALDAMSMFTTVTLLLFANLARGEVLSARRLVPAWAVSAAAGYAVGFFVPLAVSLLMFAFFVSVLGSEVWLSRKGWSTSSVWFRSGLTVFMVGVTIWTFSVIDGQALCRPTALLQGHALWHVTSAIAIAAFARHAQVNLSARPVPSRVHAEELFGTRGPIAPRVDR